MKLFVYFLVNVLFLDDINLNRTWLKLTVQYDSKTRESEAVSLEQNLEEINFIKADFKMHKRNQ